MDLIATRILLVDSDTEARGFLAEQLTADGFEVYEAETAGSAERMLTTLGPDLVIVDPVGGHGDGLGLLSLVREADRTVSRIDAGLPLLVTSARAWESDRVRALDCGADDFVAKPYSYPELRARIRALMRRRERASHTPRVRVGPLEVDPLGRQAWLGSDPLQLSSKEFSLLRTLASDPWRVFGRDELMELVWGWSEPGASRQSRTLDSHASRLRKKFAAHGVSFVVNVWGIGYRLTDPVAPLPR